VTLEERVAIKFLLPQALSSGEAVARFLREARAAVRIKSEHVARVTDVGQLESGAPYMIMEYLDGADLGSVVQRQGALSVEDSVEYVLQACEALAEAHALGIVHRDLKPANLFLVRRADGTPSVKVLDFGISKTTGLDGSNSDLGMTKTQAVMGSPLYMSPEQMVSARDVDARTDLWALGAILYELLTGKVPFEANTITQLCAMILQQEAPALRNSRPDAPEPLQGIITRCLQKDRSARYASVAEFAQALGPFAPRRARISVERVSRVLASAGLATSRTSFDDVPPPSSELAARTGHAWGASGVKRGGAGKVIGIAVAVLLLGGIALGGVFALRSRPEAAASASPSVAAAPTPTAPIAGEKPVTTAPAPPPAALTASVATSAPIASTAVPRAVIPSPASPKPASPKPARPAGAAVTPTPPKPTAAAAPVPPPPAPAAKPAKKPDLYGDRK
jgi:serine/threonine-protein kinase